MNRHFELVDSLNRRYYIFVDQDDTLVKALNYYRQGLADIGILTYEIYERMCTDMHPVGRKGKLLFVYSDYNGMPYVSGIQWYNGEIERGYE